MFELLRHRSISDLKLAIPLSEARKRARILVIEDDEQAFPVKLLENEGYNVQRWARVENIRKLEEGEFDIIILDIGGISLPEMSQRDGFGVLEHLKKYNPAQIVVAYSGQSFDLSKQQFFKQADDFLAKPSDLLECKEKIDRLLQTRFTAKHYWETLIELLKRNDVPAKKIKRFESFFVQRVEENQSISLETIIDALKVAKELAEVVWTVAEHVRKFAHPGP